MFLPLGSQQSVSEETPRYSGQLFDPQNESELQWLYESQITVVVVVVVAAEKDVVVIIVVLAVVIVVMIVDVAVVVVEFSPTASASLFARGQRGKKNLTINLARSAIIRATRLSSA